MVIRELWKRDDGGIEFCLRGWAAGAATSRAGFFLQDTTTS